MNNVSQLAGFAKRDDLRYFAKAICGIGYEHIPALAPTQDILDDYKKSKGAWSVYAEKFLDLMARRKIETIDQARIDGACLLCSEDKPHHRHRRLVAEYLKERWGNVEIEHPPLKTQGNSSLLDRQRGSTAFLGPALGDHTWRGPLRELKYRNYRPQKYLPSRSARGTHPTHCLWIATKIGMARIGAAFRPICSDKRLTATAHCAVEAHRIPPEASSHSKVQDVCQHIVQKRH